MANLLNLREGHIAGTIQLFMIKAGLAKRIAARGHKQDYGAEPLFALGRADELNELGGFVRHSLVASLRLSRRYRTGSGNDRLTPIRKRAIEGRSLPLAVL